MKKYDNVVNDINILVLKFVYKEHLNWKIQQYLYWSYDNEINKVFIQWLHDKFGVTYWF